MSSLSITSVNFFGNSPQSFYTVCISGEIVTWQLGPFQDEDSACDFKNWLETQEGMLLKYQDKNQMQLKELNKKIITEQRYYITLKRNSEKIEAKDHVLAKAKLEESIFQLRQQLGQGFDDFCSFIETYNAEWDAILAELEKPYPESDPSSDEPEM